MGVGFPDVNLRATAAILARTKIEICFTGLPTLHVGFTVIELHAMRASVANAKFGAGVTKFSLGTIPIHLYEVQGTIEAIIEVGVIHCVCELLVLQVEVLVGIIIWHRLLGGVDIMLLHIFDGSIDARWLELSKSQAHLLLCDRSHRSCQHLSFSSMQLRSSSPQCAESTGAIRRCIRHQ